MNLLGTVYFRPKKKGAVWHILVEKSRFGYPPIRASLCRDNVYFGRGKGMGREMRRFWRPPEGACRRCQSQK